MKIKNIIQPIVAGIVGMIWGILMVLLIKDRILSLVCTTIGAFCLGFTIAGLFDAIGKRRKKIIKVHK